VYWFILTLPLGFIFAALLASRLYAKWRRAENTDRETHEPRAVLRDKAAVCRTML